MWVIHDKKFLVFREIDYFTIKIYKKFQSVFLMIDFRFSNFFLPNFLRFKIFAL